MTVEQRLRTALQEGAERLDVPGAGPGAAQRRARQRDRRLHGLVTTAVVAILAAGVATVWGGVTAPAPSVLMDGGGATDPGDARDGPVEPVEADPLRLEWRDAEGVVGSARETFLGSDGAYYALSTAPGVRWRDYPGGDLPQALYRSGDGLDWEVVELGDEPWVASLGERDGLLYALTTAPGTQGGSGRVAVSGDSGLTWQRTDLPSVAKPPEATVAMHDPQVTGHLAVGDDLLVATVHTRYPVDVSRLFAAELSDNLHVRATPEGFAAFELPHEDVVAADLPTVEADGHERGDGALEGGMALRTVTWEEMGLGGPGDLSDRELFVSRDGAAWEPVRWPFGSQAVQALEATPHGFVAMLQGLETDGTPGAFELARSVDGVTWEPVTGAPVDRPLQGLGAVDGGRLLAVPHPDGAALTVAVSDDGGASWSEVDLAPVLPGDHAHAAVLASDTGPLGAALVVLAVSDGGGYHPEHFLLTSTDGLQWSTTPIADVVRGDRPTEVPWVTVGRDTILLGVIWPPAEDGATAPSGTFVGTPIR